MTVATINAIDTASNEEIEITIEDKALIAEEGWATVYRATLSPSGETVAIKQVIETTRYKVCLAVFEMGRLIEKHRELELMRLIPPHENIIRLRYCAIEPDPTEETARLLMLFIEYLPTTLNHLIQDHASGMEMSLVQVYSKQLLSALAHLACLNIVHRDILPRNILIDPVQQKLKLADFGCAKIVTPEIANHPTVGTWQYRALELLFGATHYGPEAG